MTAPEVSRSTETLRLRPSCASTLKQRQKEEMLHTVTVQHQAVCNSVRFGKYYDDSSRDSEIKKKKENPTRSMHPPHLTNKRFAWTARDVQSLCSSGMQRLVFFVCVFKIRCSDVKPTHTLVRELVRPRLNPFTPTGLGVVLLHGSVGTKGLTLIWTGAYLLSSFPTGSYGCLWHWLLRVLHFRKKKRKSACLPPWDQIKVWYWVLVFEEDNESCIAFISAAAVVLPVWTCGRDPSSPTNKRFISPVAIPIRHRPVSNNPA